MKISVILLFAMVALTTSCTKKVTEIQQVDQAFSAVYSLTSANWTTSDNGNSYFTNLSVPELDDKILAGGAVIVYLSFDNGTTYEAIPEVFNGIAYGAVHVSQSVTIDLHAVDGSNITAPAGTVLAKVVLIDATGL